MAEPTRRMIFLAYVNQYLGSEGQPNRVAPDPGDRFTVRQFREAVAFAEEMTGRDCGGDPLVVPEGKVAVDLGWRAP